MIIEGSQMSYDMRFIENEFWNVLKANTKKDMTQALRKISAKASDMKHKVNARGDAYFTEQWDP